MNVGDRVRLEKLIGRVVSFEAANPEFLWVLLDGMKTTVMAHFSDVKPLKAFKPGTRVYVRGPSRTDRFQATVVASPYIKEDGHVYAVVDGDALISSFDPDELTIIE